MRNRIPKLFASLLLTFVFGMSLMAQEKTEVTVQVKKDGKVVKDTTYQFEDEAEAKHAIQMMEHYHHTKTHSDEGHSKVMVFISEDGEKTEIKHLDGDSLGEHKKVFISDDDENVYVIKGDGDDVHVEIEEIMKEHGEGENVKVVVVIKKDEDHDEDEDEVEVEVEVIKKKKKKKN